MLDFLTRQKLSRGMVLTKNVVDSRTLNGHRIDMMPFYLL
jgi:hypothetical protein